MEIERRFLVKGNFPKDEATSINIVQGYISRDKNHTVRVRIAGNEAFLTVKGCNKQNGCSHLEIEKNVSVEEARQLLDICEPGIITKKRYFVPCNDAKHVFEVDVYEGNNQGLVIAEIELSSEADCFTYPSWLGTEITHDYRYSNSSLSLREISSVAKPVIYIDMDGVLVDFNSGVDEAEPFFRERYKKNPDYIPGVFNLMKPMHGALEAVNILLQKYDLYILSTASWNNPLSWMEKRQWVGRYFGETFHKRLILTHHKELNLGDYLIDDRERNGASEFKGTLIRFGSDEFPDWQRVVDYLMNR